jgi:transglutaminase-like putative cysteine protease
VTGTDAGTARRAQRLVELTLAGLTGAAVLGLARLFEGASFFTSVLAFALVGHGLALLCRRRGLPGGATAVVGVGGLVLGVSWLLLLHTTAYLLPTPTTVAEAGDRLAEAWDVFSSVRAPAPVHPGLVLAAAVATYVIAWVADTAAFRAAAPVEAAVPAASLFLFGAALGAPPLRAPTTAIFVAAVLAYWLATRAWRATTSPSWAGHQVGGAGALLSGGSRLAGAAVLGALVVGPLLPGAGASALIPWRASDRNAGTRLTVSPLVDIRARIVDQAEVEVFRVRSEVRSYWRLTALDEFDGRIWRSDGRFRSATEELADIGGVQPLRPGPDVLIDQEVEVLGLDAVWLPAAYRPVAFSGGGGGGGAADVDVGVDEESGTLIIGRDQSSEGLRYEVQSLVRLPTEAGLREASTRVRPVDRLYTTLPRSFSPAARRLAAGITAGQPTPYDRARALQDHFRSGAYRYDTSVDPGHGEDDLERFLLQTRAGYCEQFAGAYAALARAIGLPARVAVGFTPGELQNDGSYHVRGSHGHAWPEVFLGEAGWVPFEPTPGRGIPGGEGYTGVAEEQAGPDGDQSGATTTSTTSTTVAGGATTTTPAGRPFDDAADAAGGEGDSASPWPARLAWAALAAVVLLVAWVLLLALATWLRRTRRRRAARTTSGRVLVAWDEVGEALTAAGRPRRPAETPVEYAERVAGSGTVDAGRLRGLALRATEAGWAAEAVDEAGAAEAVAAAAAVEHGVRATRTRGEHLRATVDPRPLLPRRTGRVEIRELPALPGGVAATPRA